MYMTLLATSNTLDLKLGVLFALFDGWWELQENDAFWDKEFGEIDVVDFKISEKRGWFGGSE